MRFEWEMVFVESGAKALQVMETEVFDVVVSDMRMPGMNGAELMRHLLQRHPDVIRIILSGHADRDLIGQCLGTAHQYLSKPCDPEILKSLIAKACQLGGDIGSNRVRELLGSIERLPSMPGVYRDLSAALAADTTAASELGRIVALDMGMTAKILKLVNSAFFGLRRELTNPVEAVTYLGIETVRSLVLANGIFEVGEPLATKSMSMEKIWGHSLAVAVGAKAVARVLSGEEQHHDEAFTGGLLHDVGVLVLAANFPEAYDEAMSLSDCSRGFLPLAEQRHFGVNHGEVGAYLMGLWGLPAIVVESIRYHHFPCIPGTSQSVPLLSVHLADALLAPLTLFPSLEQIAIDPAVLKHPLVEGRMDAIRSVLKLNLSGHPEITRGLS
jgi:putative nucleotidyltransferase with HDIG domain